MCCYSLSHLKLLKIDLGKKKGNLLSMCAYAQRLLPLFILASLFSLSYHCFSPLHLELLLSFLRYDMLRIPAAFSAVYFCHIDLFCPAKIMHTHHCACNVQEIAKQCI